MSVNQAVDKAVEKLNIKNRLAIAMTNNIYEILDETMGKENLI